MSQIDTAGDLSVIPANPGAGFLSVELHPDQMIARNVERATVLKRVVEKQGLFTKIGAGKHLRIEGWQTIGAMTGCFAQVEWSRQIEGGWEARAIVKTMAGQVVGAAESMCHSSERNWNNREAHALRSMAQTRAMSKALSGPLRFIVALAGYEGTPAEEMPSSPSEGVFQRPKVGQPGKKAPAPVVAEAPVAPVAKAVAAPTAKAKPTTEAKPVVAEVGTVWEGVIDRVMMKAGKKKNGEGFKLFTVIGMGGERFATFSESMATDCKYAAENAEPMKIRYTTNDYGNQAEQAWPASMDEDAAPATEPLLVEDEG